MARMNRVVVLCAVAAVAGLAAFAMASDTTEGLVRLEGQALENARAAKATQHGSPGDGTFARLEQPIKLDAIKARAAGTITYDSTTITGVSTSFFSSYGNRFDSALNVAGTAVSPVMLSGSVTHATWGVISSAGATTWGPMWITLYDQLNTGAGTANVVSSSGFSVGGGPYTAPLLVNAAVGPWSYTGPTFLMGGLDYNTNATTPNGVAIAIDANMTLSGQGWHGFSMVWGPGTGTGYASLGPANVIMRASGNVIVPVELMNFTIE